MLFCGRWLKSSDAQIGTDAQAAATQAAIDAQTTIDAQAATTQAATLSLPLLKLPPENRSHNLGTTMRGSQEHGIRATE